MNKISNYTNCIRVTNSTSQTLIPTAVALGKFDGLHRGHQRVIQSILSLHGRAPGAASSGTLSQVERQETGNKSQKQEDKRQGEQGTTLSYVFRLPCTASTIPLKEQVYPTVVTFNPHPQEFFTGKPCPLLTPLKEKVQQLLSWRVQQLSLLPFNKELAALSPQDFVEKILVQQLHARMISVGEDFRFGKQRSGAACDLQAIAAKFGIPVVIVPNCTCEGDRISSSSIRQALAQGDLRRANVQLNHPYQLTGTVVKGQQLDRSISFPTANIQLPPNKFLPRHGTYAVRVSIVNETVDASSLPNHLLLLAVGIMNIGNHLTVHDTHPSVKIHLLDWSGNLYGKTLTVQLEKFLRPEQKISSLEALKAQIIGDCAMARSLLLAKQSAFY
ncbi:MAG: bifunctional riboflavin kinase/FAD synthetase [Chroococcidiopsidaceae cyanobacterium CP_BM_RX_35]|nr:bifunctional riboflavin kinase/FAD synthetase [Chroococcidiopsidaceae cyanobacterium CP_BM_RX_35]